MRIIRPIPLTYLSGGYLPHDLGILGSKFTLISQLPNKIRNCRSGRIVIRDDLKNLTCRHFFESHACFECRIWTYLSSQIKSMVDLFFKHDESPFTNFKIKITWKSELISAGAISRIRIRQKYHYENEFEIQLLLLLIRTSFVKKTN